jgi:peptidoglycan/LPS O-acetylase OafA/YrhL
VITVVSPLAGMLCRRFGRRLPLFAGAAVVALGCAMALRVGPNATYWADFFPSILLLALGMSLAIALFGGVLQQGGPQLFSGFHMAMAVAAVACVLATLAVFIIESGPHSTSSRETDPFGVRNRRAGKAERKR